MLPNVYFHVTTAFAILRHNGVPIGKFDYLLVKTHLRCCHSVISAGTGTGDAKETPQTQQGDGGRDGLGQAQDRADSALINDIRDEDIQGEYLGAFGQIRSAVVNLVAKYTTDGFCEETEGLLALYKGLITQFEEEYEL